MRHSRNSTTFPGIGADCGPAASLQRLVVGGKGRSTSEVGQGNAGCEPQDLQPWQNPCPLDLPNNHLSQLSAPMAHRRSIVTSIIYF